MCAAASTLSRNFFLLHSFGTLRSDIFCMAGFDFASLLSNIPNVGNILDRLFACFDTFKEFTRAQFKNLSELCTKKNVFKGGLFRQVFGAQMRSCVALHLPTCFWFTIKKCGCAVVP